MNSVQQIIYEVVLFLTQYSRLNVKREFLFLENLLQQHCIFNNVL